MRHALREDKADQGAVKPLSRTLGVHGWEAIDPEPQAAGEPQSAALQERAPTVTEAPPVKPGP